MTPKLIILDFDGTFTEVDREALPFLSAYKSKLCAALSEEIAEEWAEAETRINADPDRYGWEHEGRIVAPSHADPYILATSCGQLILERRAGFERSADRRALLDGLFRECYPLADTVFRPDAKAVVEALLRSGRPVYVVTNSHTKAVQKKIDALAPEGKDRLTVCGDAKKYIVCDSAGADPRFRGLPEEQALEGLKRPILLRRGLYFDLLQELWEKTGAAPEETVICGDIYELDLAMPAALGVRVHMVARPNTPSYERRAVASSGGSLSEHLGGLLEAVDLS